MRASLLLFMSVVCGSSRAAAQSLVEGPVPSVLFSVAAQGPLGTAELVAAADSIDRDIRPTAWKEGALIGGLIGAVGGAVLGAAFCRNSEEFGKSCTGSAVAGGLISAVVLAIPGALIGGQMHKGGDAE